MGARVLAGAMSLAYVGSVYIFPGGRSRNENVEVVWRRVLGVTILTTFAVFNFGYGHQAWFLTMNLQVIFHILCALAIIHMLYAVPLIAHGGPDLRQYRVPPNATTEQKYEKMMIFLRNIVVGPATEELVYRGVMMAIYRSEGLSSNAFLRENCIYFALAHLHHAVMRYLDGVVPFKLAMQQALVHFTITSLFGIYSSYWLLRTGTIWPSIISHSVCNLYGTPEFSGPSWYMPAFFLGIGFFFYSLCLI